MRITLIQVVRIMLMLRIYQVPGTSYCNSIVLIVFILIAILTIQQS